MIRRSALLALVVGTILVAINSGGAILSRDLSAATLARIGLTYAVPFLVSLYTWRSAVRALRPGQVTRRSATVVCVTCEASPRPAITVQSGGTIPQCEHCGADARWVARVARR